MRFTGVYIASLAMLAGFIALFMPSTFGRLNGGEGLGAVIFCLIVIAITVGGVYFIASHTFTPKEVATITLITSAAVLVFGFIGIRWAVSAVLAIDLWFAAALMAFPAIPALAAIMKRPQHKKRRPTGSTS